MARTNHLRLFAATLLATLLPSCIAARRPIVLDSTPPGAAVFIDGRDSGHSTPCNIQLADKRREVEFRLDGYEPEVRRWRVGDRSSVVYITDAVVDTRTWAFPLWLGAADFFFPVKVLDGEMPHRIHVRLKRRREPLALLR